VVDNEEVDARIVRSDRCEELSESEVQAIVLDRQWLGGKRMCRVGPRWVTMASHACDATRSSKGMRPVPSKTVIMS